VNIFQNSNGESFINFVKLFQRKSLAEVSLKRWNHLSPKPMQYTEVK